MNSPAPKSVSAAAFRPVAAYVVFSCLWIVFSDALVFWLVKDTADVVRVNLLKGWGFVVVTALLLFVLVRRAMVAHAATQRVQLSLQQAQTESERLRGALDHVSGLIYMKDTQSRYLYANQSTLDRFACTAQELVGADDARFFPAATVLRLRESDQRVLAGESTEEVIDVVDGQGKRTVYWEVKTPLYADKARTVVDGLCSFSTDITALRLAEEAQALQARRADALLALPAAAETMNESDFMQHGQELAEQLTSSQIAFIHFVNDDQETIELVNWSRSTLAHYCTAAFDSHYPVSQAGIWAEALRQRQAVVFNDYAMASGKRGLPEGHARLDRLMSVPVIESGLVRMMSGVGNKPTSYTDLDVETVRLVAETVWRIVRQRRADLALQREVAERRAQQAQLKLAAQVFAQGREGITITDAAGNIIMANQAFTRVTGYAESEVLGKNPRFLKSGRQTPEFYLAMWESIREQGYWEGEIWNQRKDGTLYPEWLAISAMRGSDGETTHYVGSFSDLTESKEAENRIHLLSHFDLLTGLPNRHLLKDRTELAISMAQRAGHALAMLLVSVDQLRELADTLGHALCDELVVMVAQRLSAHLRDQDTVASLEGREFVLVLPDTAANGAAHLATEIQARLGHVFELGGRELSVTVSVGIAVYPENGSDFDSLLSSVEIALHRAQASGRGLFQFFDAEIYQQVIARDLRIKALREAVALEQLQLLYQPQADLQTGQLCGLEALLRWNHPEWGVVSPAEFIPLAEETGLIDPIGEWVMRRACQDVRSWLDAGLQVPPVAVNVSPLQFHNMGLVAQIQTALRDYRVDAARLELEVTESGLMDDVPHSERLLGELKGLGVKLSLDDFGTGYSSLSYLKRFPFDTVKIDQSFVRDLTLSESDRVLVNVIISMAHGLGMRVIAEGVETEAQCDVLRNSVCDEIQGYLLSRPVNFAAISSVLTQGYQLPGHLLRLAKPRRTLLLVDDEPSILAALNRVFRREGYTIYTANSGQQGLELLAKQAVDVIISDQRMPGMTGIEFLRIAKVSHPDTIRVILSGYTELVTVTDAINEGAVYRFLTKPWDDEALREQVRQALAYKELQEENKQLGIKVRSANQELVAANRQLENVLQQQHLQLTSKAGNLAILREALQGIPFPVIGLDRENTIVLINAAAAPLFGPDSSPVGVQLANCLPSLQAALVSAVDGQHPVAEIDGSRYSLHVRQVASSEMDFSGRVITLARDGMQAGGVDSIDQTTTESSL
ncbi:MAG: EAL domain-containing protein [Rhodoferax sp.]|nr:EAL domain-containing protein [Rhodoferax sp.]